MKRMKLLAIMSFAFLILSGCGDKNVENDNAEVKVENDAMQEESVEMEEPELIPESYYEYTITNEGKGGVLHTMGINAPEGFYLKVNDPKGVEVNFENAAGTRIRVAQAFTSDLERCDNYFNNGIWESRWSSEIAEGDREVETPYGTVKLIIGNRIESDEPYAETGYFTYNDADWVIERQLGPGTEDIGQILNEMFTGKAELPEEKFPSVDVAVEDSEYSYILKSSDYEYNIFGFNLDGNRFEAFDENSRLYFRFAEDKESLFVGYTTGSDVIYLKDFLVTGNVPATVDFRLFPYSGELLSIESKESIDTKYGGTQIVYMTVHAEDADHDEFGAWIDCDITCEECIFEVNDCEIIVQYFYPKDKIYEYQGVLKELFQEMF